MDFETLQVIWDSQNERPLFAFNQVSLHAFVKRKSAAIERRVVWFEFAMIAFMLATGIAFAAEPLLYGDDQYQYIGATIFLSVAAYLWLQRRRRRRNDEKFEASLRGDLDKAISHLDYQMNRLNASTQWYILPVCAVMAVGFVALQGGKPWWLYAAMAAVLAWGYWSMRREARNVYLPKKRQLEALRAKLVDEGCESNM